LGWDAQNKLSPTKQPALRLSRTKNLHFAKATFPGFSAFDNALRYKVDEIYVTIFDKTDEQKRLIELLCDNLDIWGIKIFADSQKYMDRII
jgi:hypothetical protein